MYSVRRSAFAHPAAALVPVALVATVVAAGCGSSITAVTPRTTTSSAVPTPFCQAVDESRAATAPVAGWRMGQRVTDVADIATRIRAADQQVGSLAPQELRGDFDRLTTVLDRQLRLLETSGGDTLALTRDPELANEVSDPAYVAAQQRVDDYVRRTC